MSAGAPLILASTSVYRARLLARLGLPFTAVAPDYVEEHDLDLPVADLVGLLARRKAESLRARYPEAILIGSDQAAEIDGRLLGKPGTAARAVAQLAELAGRTHRLWTALCVLAPDGLALTAVDEHRLTMRALAPAMIKNYVAIDQPLDCAGAYKIEGLGVALFSAVQGEDPSAIEGLPLMRLTAFLAQLGRDPLQSAPRV